MCAFRPDKYAEKYAGAPVSILKYNWPWLKNYVANFWKMCCKCIWLPENGRETRWVYIFALGNRFDWCQDSSSIHDECWPHFRNKFDVLFMLHYNNHLGTSLVLEAQGQGSGSVSDIGRLKNCNFKDYYTDFFDKPNERQMLWLRTKL